MKTKRFILMLLVMLGSVTGAWATDTGADVFSTMCLETQNIKVTPAGVIDGTHTRELVIWEDNNKTKIEAKNGVKIKQILLVACTGVGISYGVSASGASEIINDFAGFYTINFTNGVTSTIIGPGNGYPGNSIFCATAISVTYEYPDHTHSYAGSWTHDDECHWHECTSLIGLCKDKQGSKAPHNYGDSGEAYYTCQTCGYVNVQRKHVHVPADTWSYDAIQHWHACTCAVGTCDANGKLDLANHTYGQDGTARYTCSVCNYVNETRRTEFVGIDYMSFTAVGGDMTIGMAKTGSPDDYTMQYSLDKIDWYTVALTATNSNIVEIEDGQTYYFRHGSSAATDHVSSNGNYWTFTMTSTSDDATVEAGGNVMSLLDMTCQKNSLSKYTQHVFSHLFLNCKLLTVAPKIVTTSVGNWNFVSMFAGSGIRVAPELTAATVEDGAYYGMFENCKELVCVPALPATALSRCAYWDMFKGCDKLTSIEIANIESMVVEEGSTGRENSFHDMLAGTAMETNGVIIAPIEMMGDTRITLPSNWQWATKLKLNEDPTVGEEGNFYTTFYDSRYNYNLPSGVKAYTATIAEEDGDKVVKLTAIEGDILPKGVAVLLHSNTTGEMLMTVSEDNGNEPAMNLFCGVDVETEPFNPNYMLSYGQEGLGFYMMNPAMKLSANKAFLPAADPAMTNIRAFRMVFEDEETGIENINDDDTLRYDNDNIYSVSGVRQQKLQKGINIVNGKKVFIK